MNSLKKIVCIFGTQSNFAHAICCSQQRVNNWLRRGRIPAEMCPEIEKKTGITCEELRPDIDWAYLRSTTPRERPADHVADAGKMVGAEGEP